MTASELLLLARCTLRVLRNSEETDGIHVAEELTGRARYAAIRRELFAAGEGRELLHDRAELRSDQVDYEALRRLPEETLGHRYVGHLDRNGLSADCQAAPTRHVDDPELAFLMRRFRQTHDVWHALTELGTAGYEEVLIHAFSWGQLRLPVSALVVVFGGLKHILFEGRVDVLRHGLLESYQHGRDAKPLLPVYWERYWEEPMDHVRRRFGVARRAMN